MLRLQHMHTHWLAGWPAENDCRLPPSPHSIFQWQQEEEIWRRGLAITWVRKRDTNRRETKINGQMHNSTQKQNLLRIIISISLLGIGSALFCARECDTRVPLIVSCELGAECIFGLFHAAAMAGIDAWCTHAPDQLTDTNGYKYNFVCSRRSVLVRSQTCESSSLAVWQSTLKNGRKK